MYVKVFRQIFDSSVAENYQTRWVFQDLLILADKTGVVDMTVTAISRTTGVPRELVAEAVRELEQPDSHSRNPDHEGRRLLRLDDHRDWGWKIANYEDYRDIQDEEARRGMWAQQKREQRSKERERKMSRTRNGHSQTITDCPQLSTNVRPSEAEAEADTNSSKKKKKASRPASPEEFRDYCDAYCKEQNIPPGNWTHLLDRFLASGWKLSRGQPVSDWQAHARNYINRGWHLNGHQVQATLPIATPKSQYITRDMIDEWCCRKKYSKLAPIAWGKLMGGKHFGVAIDNEEDFDAAMSSILTDWLRTP